LIHNYFQQNSSGSRVLSDDEEENRENLLFIESNYLQQFDSTYFEDTANEDDEENGKGDC